MTTAKILVTVAGAAAIVWVLWYFLATPGSSRAERSRPKS
jgi:hypothetical protein